MNETQHHVIADLAQSLVEHIAPQEMPLFRATSTAYFKNPRKALGGQSGRDEMLGFGGGDAATFLTPIILIAATKVVEFATEPATQPPPRGLSGLLNGFMKKLARPIAGPADDQSPAMHGRALQPLTPEQIARARELAIGTLRQHNFPEDKVGPVADALVARLAATAT